MSGPTLLLSHTSSWFAQSQLYLSLPYHQEVTYQGFMCLRQRTSHRQHAGATYKRTRSKCHAANVVPELLAQLQAAQIT